MHISGLLTSEKVDIESKEVDIESILSVKGKDFSLKTAIHIRKLFEKYGYDEVFGRSVVMEKANINLKILASRRCQQKMTPLFWLGPY